MAITVVNKIKAIREECGNRQNDMAEVLGVSRQTMTALALYSILSLFSLLGKDIHFIVSAGYYQGGSILLTIALYIEV